MNHLFTLYLLLNSISLVSYLPITRQDKLDEDDYIEYHRTVTQAQKLATEHEYQKSLELYRGLFSSYDFVFSKDYRVATQLALQTGNDKDTFIYLRKAMATGWSLKEIKKFKFLNRLQNNPEWKVIERQYDSLQTIVLPLNLDSSDKCKTNNLDLQNVQSWPNQLGAFTTPNSRPKWS